MKELSSRTRFRLLFYSLLTIINLIQGAKTGLFYDEAYYWYISFHMDWGHFYHPPLIDVLDQAGYSLLQSKLGLRLFFIVLSTSSIYLLERLIKPRPEQLWVYYAIVSTIVFLQVGGIFAALDIPLFFFGVCFFTVLKQYLDQQTNRLGFLLGLMSTMLLYSKYHGVLIIIPSFLLLLPRFYRKRSFYVWPIISLLLFMPHIYWQVSHHFPTVNFHLFSRPNTHWFDIGNLDYIPGQLLFAGPITSFFLIYGIIKRKITTLFERLLLGNLIVIYSFFFLYAFYTHIEANWGVLPLIPLVILGFRALCDMPKLLTLFKKTIMISLVLSLLLRLALFFPDKSPIGRLDREFAGWDKFARIIDSLAQGRPVVMMTRYQYASAYAFYSQKKFVHVSYPDQPSDFNLIDTEDRVLNKEVLLCSRKIFDSSQVIKTNKGTWYYKIVPKFKTLSQVMVTDVVSDGTSGSLEYKLLLKPSNKSSINTKTDLDGKLFIRYYKNSKVLTFQDLGDIKRLGLKTLDIPKEVKDKGKLQCQFFVKAGDLMAMPCSKIFEISFI